MTECVLEKLVALPGAKHICLSQRVKGWCGILELCIFKGWLYNVAIVETVAWHGQISSIGVVEPGMFHKLSRQLLLHHLGEEFLLLLLLN